MGKIIAIANQKVGKTTSIKPCRFLGILERKSYL
jgi:hypothetical protein